MVNPRRITLPPPPIHCDEHARPRFTRYRKGRRMTWTCVKCGRIRIQGDRRWFGPERAVKVLAKRRTA